jgi:hypothetical protein
MDEYQHQTLSNLQNQTTALKEVTKKLDLIANLLQDIAKLQKEQLSFFVAIDKREMGLDDTNAQEYLTELRNDGFEPRTE